MESHSDAEKADHHRRLIADALSEDFPDATIEVGIPAMSSQTYTVHGSTYLKRVFVPREILEDSRPDEDLEREIHSGSEWMKNSRDAQYIALHYDEHGELRTEYGVANRSIEG